MLTKKLPRSGLKQTDRAWAAISASLLSGQGVKIPYSAAMRHSVIVLGGSCRRIGNDILIVRAVSR